MTKAPKKAKPVRLTDWQERTINDLKAGSVIEYAPGGTHLVHPDGKRVQINGAAVQTLLDLKLVVRLKEPAYPARLTAASK